MTAAPAITRHTPGSWRTRSFAVTVTGRLVMLGSIPLAQLANGSVHWKGNR